MTRTNVLIGAVTMLIIGGLFVALHHRHGPPTPPAALIPQEWDEIVTLPNGSTLMARRGSVGRKLVDWLASGDSSAASFEIGRTRIHARGAAAELRGRRTDSAARHDAWRLSAGGCGSRRHTHPSGNAQADAALSLARATYVADELKRSDISARRITVSGIGASRPLASDSPLRASGATDNPISLTLRHHTAQ
jgi:hypothetical protein